MVGARFAVRARVGTGEDNIVLIRATVSHVAFVPLRSHGNVECFCLFASSMEVFLDGDAPGWHKIETGRSLTSPGDVCRAVRNASDRPADAVLATTVR